MVACSVDGCSASHYAKGFCEKHWRRNRKYGTPDGDPLRTHASFEDRFWRRVNKTKDCWIWSGSRLARGYGRVQMGGKGSRYEGAHRASFEMANGFMPEVVMHVCDNPSCVRPDHLKAGTYKENTADMFAKGRFRPGGARKGTKNHNAKLTPDDVRKIRKRQDESAGSVGRDFNVGHKTILAIWRGITWKHIT